MIVVNVVIESTQADIAAMKPAMAAMESASRAEDGCEDYTYSVELNNPNIIRITERWQTVEALRAHFQAPHMGEFQAAMAKHPPKSSEVHFFEATEFNPAG